MFSAVFRRAQATVDNAIEQAISRVILAIPFVIAGGFATAALSLWLMEQLGAQLGCLAVAAIYCLLGLIAAPFLLHHRSVEPAGEEVPAVAAEHVADPQSAPAVGDALDEELLKAALASAAPVALPGLIRLIMRNLPVVAAIVAALYVSTREAHPDAADKTGSAEPAPA